ncbi:MAG: VWA domain-containing protein [Betaproteobacteria bacterium]|nr:VWA domain-containing protein [Betaproteobacteria bacterium]
MLAGFFLKLKDAKLPVSIKEYLTLIEGMSKHVISPSIDEFYYLSRMTLVKDESNFDKFDRAFGEYFKGVESLAGMEADIPLEWLLKQAELNLSDEEKAKIEALGGWEKLMELLKKRLEEQKERHQGGSKWIGTAGTSPFGAYGYNPEGIRIGQEGSRNRSAVKVWDKREYQNLDDSVELGTRNIKVALRRLRKFAREGAPEELDLDTTIDKTARNAGWLDLHMRPERHNTVKVLLFLDIGGSMDDHIKLCRELFSATKTEFKHMEYFYFHNCLYDFVWKDNRRRHAERTRTWDILHKYGHDYKLIFVGDATMSPYEILQPGGSIEYSNDEAGSVWIKRMLDVYHKAVWLNPEPEEIWPYRQSIGILRELMAGRMYPTTIEGLERAMRYLSQGNK